MTRWSASANEAWNLGMSIEGLLVWLKTETGLAIRAMYFGLNNANELANQRTVILLGGVGIRLPRRH